MSIFLIKILHCQEKIGIAHSVNVLNHYNGRPTLLLLTSLKSRNKSGRNVKKLRDPTNNSLQCAPTFISGIITPHVKCTKHGYVESALLIVVENTNLTREKL